MGAEKIKNRISQKILVERREIRWGKEEEKSKGGGGAGALKYRNSKGK